MSPKRLTAILRLPSLRIKCQCLEDTKLIINGGPNGQARVQRDTLNIPKEKGKVNQHDVGTKKSNT